MTNCPICKGTGKLDKPHSFNAGNLITKKLMACALRRDGYSIRQIQKYLGYKSPRSVHLMVKDIKNEA